MPEKLDEDVYTEVNEHQGDGGLLGGASNVREALEQSRLRSQQAIEEARKIQVETPPLPSSLHQKLEGVDDDSLEGQFPEDIFNRPEKPQN